MEAQPAETEQPAESSAPAADAANAAPAPIAAPPGVPMKAPPPSLLTKEEPKEPAPTPEIGQLITLSDDLQVVRFTNGTIHLKHKGKDPETITPGMFEALTHSIRAQANVPAPSAMSGFTGLASTNRGSAPDTDADPIEWGDMDPNFRQALQDSPELLKAYNTVRNPKKVARLDPATNSFTPTTDIELPPPSVETPPPQVTMENSAQCSHNTMSRQYSPLWICCQTTFDRMLFLAWTSRALLSDMRALRCKVWKPTQFDVQF